MPSEPGAAPERGRIEGLDLLRGLAVLLVLMCHAWPGVFDGGGVVGVVVFFALSGYLITGLLLRDIRELGRVRYGRFYAHRAFRLLPALLLLLTVFAFIEGIFNVNGDRDSVLRSVIVGITYTANVPGLDHGSFLLSHLWTLATEEQFYLVWPLLLVIGLRFRRLRAVVVLAAVAIVLVLAGSILWATPTLSKIYSWPSSWAIAMLIGAAAQIERPRLERLLPSTSVHTAVAAAIGLVVVVALSFIPSVKDFWWTYLVIGPVVSLATVVLVFFLVGWKRIPTVVLRPLLALGTVSYAAYLWNKPIAGWLEAAGSGAVGAAMSIPLTVAAAAVSWFLVEKPANAARRRWDEKRAARSRASAETAAIV